MLLFYPPVAKPSEPPAGLALLAGTLKAHQQSCTTVDLNIEGLLYLLENSPEGEGNWSKRAYKNRERNLSSLRSKKLYSNIPKYQKTVLELNRLLQNHKTVGLSLANYQDSKLSPLKSDDLLQAACFPEKNLFYTFFIQRLTALLEEHNPRFAGVSINYLSQALPGFALIGLLKKLKPELKIILGGGLITSWMSKPDWRNPFEEFAYLCIDGCGAEPLLELLGTSLHHPPVPSFDHLDNSQYLSPGFILPYSCSSGCYWNRCSFCPERAEGHVFKRKDIAQVERDISRLIQKTSPVLLHFLDNAIPPGTLSHFCKHPPGAPWYGFVRISEHFLDMDFCRSLKRSGCVMLKLGIESGDQGVLEQMEKGIDLQMVAEVLDNLGRVGIGTYVYLLFGTPAEDYAAAKRTMEFVSKHHGNISFLNLAIFNMPLTKEIDERLQPAKFDDGDLSLYADFRHPLGWSRKKVRTFLDKEFKRIPVIQKILQRDPVIFTSNHAPFFQ